MEVFLAILAVVGTIFGAVIGAKLNSKYSLESVVKQKFLDAASDFRCSFVDEIRVIKKQPKAFDINKRIELAIGDAIVKHETAMIKFSSHIVGKDTVAFGQAWDEYYDYYAPYHKTPNLDYFADNLEEEIEARELLLSRIYKLFSFAEFN